VVDVVVGQAAPTQGTVGGVNFVVAFVVDSVV
jgi:hypothetical protein